MGGIAEPESIFARYVYGNIANVKRIEKFFAADDIRYVYIVDTDQDEHVAIKVTNNSFTTGERIAGWRDLIDLYNDCGVYAPRIIADRYGQISSTYCDGERTFIVYAEEKKRYPTAQERGIAWNDPPFFEEIVSACAKMAQVSVKLPGWNSAWCIYDPFCAQDATDETYMWASQFRRSMNERMSQFENQTRRIWDRFIALYEGLRPAYLRLPKAFLQGDEGDDNVLVDDGGTFVGLLDFNLAGAETILNYLFRNFCRVRIRPDEIPRLNDPSLLRAKHAEMRSRLDVVKKYYPFSDAENAAFPLYYQMVYPMECDLCQCFEKVIFSGDSEKVQLILDWIEYQQTREDVCL